MHAGLEIQGILYLNDDSVVDSAPGEKKNSHQRIEDIVAMINPQ